jgi:hypothetical protein
MVTQICPKCKKDAFTWHESDVLPNITVWSCNACPLQIFEDESDEEICENCNEVTKTFLRSQEEQFNWCSNCNTVSNYQKNE